MARPLILLAASGLAREAAEAARASGRFDPIGFGDDNHDLWGATFNGLKVLGDLTVVHDYPDAALLLCAGKGSGRRALAERLRASNISEDRYATVVHPSVGIPDSCTVGPGSIVLAGSVLTASVQIGRHVVVMPNVVLTHDDVLDDYATLCAGVVLGGSVNIGEAAYLGMAAAIRENVSIGADARVGMGSVVLGDVAPGGTVYGVPARPVLPPETHSVASSHQQTGDST